MGSSLIARISVCCLTNTLDLLFAHRLRPAMIKRAFSIPAVFLLFVAIQVFAGQRMLPMSYTAGPTPFISFVHQRFDPAVPLSSAEFTIRPKTGSETRPVHASFSSSYLEARGYLDNTTGKLTDRK